MGQSAQEMMDTLIDQIRQHQVAVTQLPGEERAIVQSALDGAALDEIAQEHGASEEAVLDILRRVAQQATGQAPAESHETGGLGSDTDPGVTGGYGETGFGSIGNEPPEPIPEEPENTASEEQDSK